MEITPRPDLAKCCCPHTDARQCFLWRHPECKLRSDDIGGMYDAAIDEACECVCHLRHDVLDSQ
jgi:hypothetical protein